MVAYEFLTQLTNTEAVLIPPEYARKLHKGAPVRVIILVDEVAQGGEATQDTPVDLISLEAIVAKIQRMGPNPNSITPASGLLAKHLRELPEAPEPPYDTEAWLQEWERFEAEMKTNSLTHEADEARKFAE